MRKLPNIQTKRGRSLKAPDQDELIDWSKADALRSKLAALDLTERDVAKAVASARTPGRKTRK
jgi:hypothetical protein